MRRGGEGKAGVRCHKSPASLGEVAALGFNPKLTLRFLDDCMEKCECVWHSVFILSISP